MCDVTTRAMLEWIPESPTRVARNSVTDRSCATSHMVNSRLAGHSAMLSLAHFRIASAAIESRPTRVKTTSLWEFPGDPIRVVGLGGAIQRQQVAARSCSVAALMPRKEPGCRHAAKSASRPVIQFFDGLARTCGVHPAHLLFTGPDGKRRLNGAIHEGR